MLLNAKLEGIYINLYLMKIINSVIHQFFQDLSRFDISDIGL